MINKYTPGPWQAREFCDSQWWVEVKGEPYHFICLTSQGNDEANAKLIAAAPLMLEMLKKAEWVESAARWDHPALLCPICEGVQKEGGHASDCALNAVLKSLLNLD